MKKIIFRLFMLLVCLVSMVVPGKANTVSAYTVSNYRTYVYYMGLTSGGNSLFAVSQKYYTGSGIGNIGKDTGPIKEKSGDSYDDLTPVKTQSGESKGLCAKIPAACDNSNIFSLYMDSSGNIDLDVASGVEVESLSIYYIMANSLESQHLFCSSQTICGSAKKITSTDSNWRKENKYGQRLVMSDDSFSSFFSSGESGVGGTVYSGFNLFSNLDTQYVSLSHSSGIYVTMEAVIKHNNQKYTINKLSEYNFSSIGNTSGSKVYNASTGAAEVSKVAALVKHTGNTSDIYSSSTFRQINEFFQTTLRPILLIVIGVLFVTVGTMTGIKIIKSSDEPEVRQEAIKKFIGLFIGAFTIAMILLFYEDILAVIAEYL